LSAHVGYGNLMTCGDTQASAPGWQGADQGLRR